ncbi:MAG TPA: hypothetical protein VGO07_01420 [Candidatus Saccharimonadales bacterium]|nr:hypothetical protein [Candidatus Saccharimonadales bacterium]
MSIKYPPDWQISVTRNKKVGNTANPTATINLRSVNLSAPYATQTPEQEWKTCATAISGDACGAAPDDKIMSGHTTTINGLEAYEATAQTTSTPIYAYYVTVIRSNHINPGGDGIPFDEFTMSAGDVSKLTIFEKIMASATFVD